MGWSILRDLVLDPTRVSSVAHPDLAEEGSGAAATHHVNEVPGQG